VSECNTIHQSRHQDYYSYKGVGQEMTDRENHFAYWVYSAVPWSSAGLQGLVLVYSIVWQLLLQR
jgi:hypothetical protein